LTLLGADFIAVQSGVAFNYGEFAIIKSGIVNLLPDAEELNRIAVSQPVGNEKIPILGFEHIGQGNIVLILNGKDGNIRLQNDKFFFAIFITNGSIPEKRISFNIFCSFRAGLSGQLGPKPKQKRPPARTGAFVVRPAWATAWRWKSAL
jgi:hypothetical protein